MVTRTNPNLGVLIGYDTSPGSERALDWAARNAADVKTPLHIVSVVPPVGRGYARSAVARPGTARSASNLAAARLRDTYPYLTVDTALGEGSPADVLLSEARDHADLIVVGSRGHGGFVGPILGSVSLRVCAHAPCPVVVVPAHETAEVHKDVAVGVAGDGDTAAIEYAVEQARRTGGDVLAVSVWSAPFIGSALAGAMRGVGGAEKSADEQRHMLEDILRPVRARARDVVIESVVRGGTTPYALVRAAACAGLLVVSARRGRRAVRMRLGPTTHAVLRQARCPVAVVPRVHESRG
ncbi:universal stress protein [Embleya sp. NPDC050154]|uniref:universal stress protein n=1 Tax=Embleya sp. NPDC050154 TaxID=3363988 RepID=UPI00379DA7C5